MKFPLANFFTFSRIFLSLAFLCSILMPGFAFKTAAAVIFLVGSFTDYLDGWAARKFKQKTALGILMDPIADKVLTLSAFLAFAQMDIVPVWMVLLVAMRDFLITGFRFLIPNNPTAQAPQKSGKGKTVFQFAAIVGILICLIIQETSYWPSRFDETFYTTVYWLMLVVVFTTLWSGVRYIQSHWHYLHGLER